MQNPAEAKYTPRPILNDITGSNVMKIHITANRLSLDKAIQMVLEALGAKIVTHARVQP